MENQLTLDQALNNIKAVLQKFVGTKMDHIILEQSIDLIEAKINEGSPK